MIRKNLVMFGFMFWLHLILIIIAYLSPFLFKWQLVLFGVLILVLQYILFNYDIFNKIQFGDEKDLTFYAKYLEYFGFNPNRRILRIFMWYVMPFIVLVIALVWQIVLEKVPLIF